jgi:hypothetical protein
MELIRKNDSVLAGLDGSPGMAELFGAAFPGRDDHFPGQCARAGKRISADDPPAR